MTPSQEAISILATQKRTEPPDVRPGDLWLIVDGEPWRDPNKQLEYVMLVLGHKKHGRHSRDGHTYVYLYHWGNRSLVTKPADLRDNDCNAMQAEASLAHHRLRGCKVRYLGNLFELLPYRNLVP